MSTNIFLWVIYMDLIKIGAFLQSLRKAKGLRQADVAEYFGVSNKTVSKWECGESLPEIPLLKALANYYDVTVDEILNGQKNGEIKNNYIHNDEYFARKALKKQALWIMIPSFALAFSFIMLLLLGYTLYRSDVGCFSGLVILFIALCLFIIGKYNEPAISDLSDNVISKIKRRKYLFNLIFISATVGLTIIYFTAVDLNLSDDDSFYLEELYTHKCIVGALPEGK